MYPIAAEGPAAFGTSMVLGVTYVFSGGDLEAHRIETVDTGVLSRLDREDKLTYFDDEVGEGPRLVVPAGSRFGLTSLSNSIS